MDRNEDALRRLEAQVSRLEGLLAGFEALREDVREHGEELAALREWRKARDVQESKTGARWIAAAGIVGGLIAKMFDWLHSQWMHAR